MSLSAALTGLKFTAPTAV